MSSTTSKSTGTLEPSRLSERHDPPKAPAPRPAPAHPIIVIEPRRLSAAFSLRELWAYRELLYFLTWRDVKVRYKQTALGAAWAILQPLFTMLIFTIFFGKLAGLGAHTGGVPYPVFAYAALLPWTFFTNAVTNSSNSLVGSAHLVTKVYFPRMIIPGASVAAGLVDFALAFAVFVGLMAYYRIAPSWNLLMLPVMLALVSLLALGVGTWMSALNVKYRDVRYALPFAMQLWMFVSPIIYPMELIPSRWRWLIALNPLTGVIGGFRSALLAQAFDWRGLGFSAALTLALLAFALRYFRRMERRFADII
jgi:lipopolysaccharide transport system permease protein